MRAVRTIPRPIWGIVLLLIVVPMVSQAGSIPHTHSASAPGLFNQDHDLTLLAASNAAALHDQSPALFTITLTAPVAPHVVDQPASLPTGTTDSRAPPVS
jgi:hypothetical protein